MRGGGHATVFHALLHCRDKGDLPLLQQALTDVNTLPQPDRIGYYEILRRRLAPSSLKLAEVATSLEHMRFYQEFVERLKREGKAEGEQMGRQAQLLRTISRQLGRRLALPGSEALAKMETLPIETLELLAEDLLDFTSPADLDAWLTRHGDEAGLAYRLSPLGVLTILGV